MNDLIKKEDSTLTEQQNQYSNLMQIAIEKNADIDKLEKLMELQERWESKEAKKSFFRAMAEFQGLCPVIIKKKKGHNCEYAPIGDIQAQVKALITKCGLSYRFEQSWDANILTLSCIVSHVDGHSETVTMTAEVDGSGKKNPIQARASSVTYLTRYTFTGSFGIATADEDMDGRLPEEFQEPKPELPEYSQEEFDKSFPKWIGLIDEGKQDAANIIKNLKAKYTVTEEMVNKINNIGEQQQ